MKHKSIISIILVLTYLFAGTISHAKVTNHETGITKSTALADKFSENGSHDAKAPHGKTTTPHSEELPHIHKFHKERIRKIKKHYDKFWLLSKLVIVICHLSILVIAYLHAVH